MPYKAAKKFWLYAVRNTVNEKLYIGQTYADPPVRRWRQHVHTSARAGNEPLYRAMRKYGVDKFEFQPLGFFNGEEDLNAAEVDMIIACKSRTFEHGYNAAPGGIGGGSGPFSESTKEKIRKALTGRKLGPEHAARVIAASKSPERRELLRRLKTGTKATQATKDLLSAQRKGVPKTVAHNAAVSAALSNPEVQARRLASRKGKRKPNAPKADIARLTDDHIRDIRQAATDGVSRAAICAWFCITKGYASQILNRKVRENVV